MSCYCYGGVVKTIPIALGEANIQCENTRKHNIPELATIFENLFTAPTMDVPDVMHSNSRETRYHAYGWTTTGFYVMIWYCYRGDGIIRIIGGRKFK